MMVDGAPPLLLNRAHHFGSNVGARTNASDQTGLKMTHTNTLGRQRRERPHLILDPGTGQITHLINGVQPPPTADKAPPGSSFQNDYTYTLIQPIAD